MTESDSIKGDSEEIKIQKLDKNTPFKANLSVN
jgi:hypothetical protein